jgi:hypothetical protein
VPASESISQEESAAADDYCLREAVRGQGSSDVMDRERAADAQQQVHEVALVRVHGSPSPLGRVVAVAVAIADLAVTVVDEVLEVLALRRFARRLDRFGLSLEKARGPLALRSSVCPPVARGNRVDRSS